MKNTRKLLPALAMLLLAAVMMSTATFAWFSMNETVTATGMQVAAKSENTYLLISSSQTTASGIQTENKTTTELTVSDDDAKLVPAAPALTDTEAGYLTTAGKKVGGDTITTAGVKVTDATTAAAVTNWYTANAAAPGAAAIDAATARQLTAFDGYVIQKTVYLTVAKGANAANSLTVTPTITQKGAGSDVSAAKIVITTSDGGFATLDSTDTEAVSIQGTNNLTDSTVITVNIYIYYDGNDTNVYTNNVANLTGATIELEFSVKPA